MEITDDLLEKFKSLEFLFEKLDAYSTTNEAVDKIFSELTKEEQVAYFLQDSWL